MFLNLSLILFLFNLLILLSVMGQTVKKSGILSSKFQNPIPILTTEKTIKYSINEEEKSSYFWLKNGQNKLIEKLTDFGNVNKAKNIIYFIGDGMSIPTLAASRIYMGQQEGKNGEEVQLSFEKFPFVGLSKTYCIDRQVADSACSATAYLCGVKGNFETIGVNGKVQLNDCKAAQNTAHHVSSIASWAQDAGKSTGIVTTTRITHASPAGNYAHTSHRNFESDFDILKNNLSSSGDCEDIASQLIMKSPGNKFNVILGGGRQKFLPNFTLADDTKFGERMDGINLINYWKDSKRRYNSEYVTDRKALNNLNFNKTDYLLGLFNADHLKYNLENIVKTEPSLTEMTESAIKLLRKNRKGFYLFVEGGRIDHAHHNTLPKKALDETVELSKAIERAIQLTSEEDTLIVVTSDHAHTMSLSGYSKRGNNILGLNTEMNAIDNIPYLTLSYANGPGYRKDINGKRYDFSNDDLSSNDLLYPSVVPKESETHGGDDVAVFANGPWAHIFSGVYEQNTIPHLISFASCIGDGLTLCSRRSA